MTEQEMIAKTMEFVKAELHQAEGGHDWFHIERVWKNTKTIAKNEPCDLFVAELGALLHDIADHKFHGGDDTIGVEKARSFLESLQAPGEVTDRVVKIMTGISFKGGNVQQESFSPELAVVQDADRLDAIGAIGIARAFNYGGFKGREMYNPAIQPQTGMTPEQYQKSTAPTLNHFYEKLLLLKDRMNTKTGREMAEQRHRYMEQFLEQFFFEWNGGEAAAAKRP